MMLLVEMDPNPEASMLRRSIVATLGFCIVPQLQAQVHDHTGGDPERLGRVTFPTSCSAEVQPEFERGMALLHSFWWDAARDAFTGVTERDPQCAMAYWGLAMSERGNPFAGPTPPAALAAGRAAIERAAELRPPTDREQTYIEALAVFFRGYEERDHATRARNYEDAMRRVADRFLDDPEASIFYAREVVANTPPTDKTFRRQRLASEILMPLFRRDTEHPGLAHYLIHTFDAPPIASEGVDAALAYSEIAPSVPHALHMPSHIFTRLGMWEESIEANAASAEAAHAFEREQGTQLVSMDRAHAWDYLVYAHLQRGEDEQALALVRESMAADMAQNLAAEYSAAAIPARYALEREDWAGAAALPARPSGFPPAAGVRHFARGIGAVRTGGADAAAIEMDALAELRDALREGNEREWADRVEAQRMAIGAWVAHLRGNTEEALTLAREAAELEEFVDKHPVTPGPILPARELQGDLLMELGRHEEALAAYERGLELEPNRTRTTFGAARAAEGAGNADRARELYGEYLELMSGATGDRAQVAEARAAVERLR
jgi:tetratricopeptide (TPR) repeat protein